MVWKTARFTSPNVFWLSWSSHATGIETQGFQDSGNDDSVPAIPP